MASDISYEDGDTIEVALTSDSTNLNDARSDIEKEQQLPVVSQSVEVIDAGTPNHLSVDQETINPASSQQVVNAIPNSHHNDDISRKSVTSTQVKPGRADRELAKIQPKKDMKIAMESHTKDCDLYHPSSAPVSDDISCYRLCQECPNHLIGAMLDPFLCRRFSALEIWSCLPEAFKDYLIDQKKAKSGVGNWANASAKNLTSAGESGHINMHQKRLLSRERFLKAETFQIVELKQSQQPESQESEEETTRWSNQYELLMSKPPTREDGRPSALKRLLSGKEEAASWKRRHEDTKPRSESSKRRKTTSVTERQPAAIKIAAAVSNTSNADAEAENSEQIPTKHVQDDAAPEVPNQIMSGRPNQISRRVQVLELSTEAGCNPCYLDGRRCYVDQTNPHQCISCPSSSHCIFGRLVWREGPGHAFTPAELVGSDNVRKEGYEGPQPPNP